MSSGLAANEVEFRVRLAAFEEPSSSWLLLLEEGVVAALPPLRDELERTPHSCSPIVPPLFVEFVLGIESCDMKLELVDVELPPDDHCDPPPPLLFRSRTHLEELEF